MIFARSAPLGWLAGVIAFAAVASAQGESPIYGWLSKERARLAAVENDAATPPERVASAKASRERIAAVLGDPLQHRVQVAVGRVVTEEGKAPRFERTEWRLDQEYFYPASAIKLCGMVAALERMNELVRTRERELTVRTPLAFNSLKSGGALIDSDPANVEGGKVTLELLIREAALVSDNAAFNRLYDFAGQQWLNERMWRAGLATPRLRHRLSVDLTANQQKVSPTIELRHASGVSYLSASISPLDLGTVKTRLFIVGAAHMRAGERINGGMSFAKKNECSLADLQKCLARIVQPDIAWPEPGAGEPFDLTAEQRELLTTALSQYPGDSKNPVYARDAYPDDYAKYFLPGLARVVPKGDLVVYSKCGEAYGFVVDNAYVLDKKNGRGFYLAATVWADSDGTLDDDKYDYASFSKPFMADLAEVVARELWNVPATN